MSNGGGDDNGPHRTVFRPSPLQGLRDAQAGAPPPPPGNPAGFGAPPGPAAAAGPIVAGERLGDDDVPLPAKPQSSRNVMMAKAEPFLALAASVRAGRAKITLPELHTKAAQSIAAFDQAIRAAGYPEEQVNRAKYALCATIDDIAQNLPDQARDAAEWARRSMVVQFFGENIGGDRFWQLVDDMLARPAQFKDLIELFHACLAAGFEGRFRVMPDGKSRHHQVMSSLYAALEHVRALSQIEMSPHWRGEPTPARKPGFWALLLLALAVAAAALFLIYLILRLLLMASGGPSMTALRAINPDQPLRLSRVAPPPPTPPPSTQMQRLAGFLAPEISKGLVKVEQDASTVRVRTTVGQLFQSGSDQLEPGRRELFERIGAAINSEKGSVKVEGHSDSDRIASVTFPDNFALSTARAKTVGDILRSKLTDGSRVTTEGFGDAQPIASNSTPAGKALNRRVEVVIPRS